MRSGVGLGTVFAAASDLKPIVTPARAAKAMDGRR
jgi:hypothetical protein